MVAKAFARIFAPGQFIDISASSSESISVQALQNLLNDNLSESSFTMIGAYGGYLIVGFDHSVRNVEAAPDLKIRGNAFAGWSEPGIVWVMQDDNGNGLPDDAWYELKGSETEKPTTIKRCAMTYYKPTAVGADVLWTDNTGRVGSVDYNGFHSQPYYYPMFMGDSYTLTGTCLASNFYVSGGIEHAQDLPWGYVDNYNTDPSRPESEFWIEDAIQADGSPANLKYIDFVKIHTGTTGKGSAVGEISTEPCMPVDMNFNR
jgi:hypothetical protein